MHQHTNDKSNDSSARIGWASNRKTAWSCFFSSGSISITTRPLLPILITPARK